MSKVPSSRRPVLGSERIAERIFLVRGVKALLDSDLADLYEIETRVLVQAVRRSLDRFPSDFMFRLTNQELPILRSQSVISSLGDRNQRLAARLDPDVLLRALDELAGI